MLASRDDVDRWYTLVQAYATLGPEQAARAAALQRDIDEQVDASLRRNHQLEARGDTSIRPATEIVITERVTEQLQAILDDLAATTALPEVAAAARAASQLVHLAAWTAAR